MAVRARPDNLALDHSAGRGAPSVDFAELWRYRDELHAVCLRMVGDPATADDLVQDTYLRALTRRDRLDRRTSFAPWLATIARRRTIDELRSEQRVRPLASLPEGLAGVADDPADQVLHQEMMDRIRGALAELGTRERQLLLRQVGHGLSLAELAEEEDTSIASVRSVLSRARAKLRTSLEQGGPLGVAPLPRLVAAVRRRLHQVAARIEGALPAFTAAGAQAGDLVAAAIAAVVLLMAGTAPFEGPGGGVARVVTTVPAASTSGQPEGKSPSTADQARPSPDRSQSSVRGAAEEQGRSPVLAPYVPPGVDVPWLPDDGADQPELVNGEDFAASEDGSVVFVTGNSFGKPPKGMGDAMYRSWDAGRSWERVQADYYFNGQVLLPPTYPAQPTFFVVSTGALLRTDNHGQSFYAVAPAKGHGTLSPRFADDRAVVLPTSGGRLARYEASTFLTTPIEAAPPLRTAISAVALEPAFPEGESILLGTEYQDLNGTRGAVYRCTLRACNQGVVLPEALVAPSLLLSRSLPGVTIAWASGMLYRSDDGGRTFSTLPSLPGISVEHVADGAPGELLLSGYKWNVLSEGSGLYRSTDGGRTWTALGLDTPLRNGALSVVRLANGNILAGVAYVGGVLCSADNGATWAQRCP